MTLNNTITFVPNNLRTQEIYPKVTEMLNYVIDNFEAELVDVKSKYTGPDIVGEDVIKEIVNELGFNYVKEVMDTITDFEFDVLLSFISLLNLLKGSKEGLELVLKLLGFDSTVKEWWEEDPQTTPDTFNITIIMDSSFVQDIEATLTKLRIFMRNYVYPTIQVIDFTFLFEDFFVKDIIMAGIPKVKIFGTIRQRA